MFTNYIPYLRLYHPLSNLTILSKHLNVEVSRFPWLMLWLLYPYDSTCIVERYEIYKVQDKRVRETLADLSCCCHS